ncbi:hypothetical protein [Streptomyces sp. NPDC058280]
MRPDADDAARINEELRRPTPDRRRVTEILSVAIGSVAAVVTLATVS